MLRISKEYLNYRLRRHRFCTRDAARVNDICVVGEGREEREPTFGQRILRDYDKKNVCYVLPYCVRENASKTIV